MHLPFSPVQWGHSPGAEVTGEALLGTQGLTASRAGWDSPASGLSQDLGAAPQREGQPLGSLAQGQLPAPSKGLCLQVPSLGMRLSGQVDPFPTEVCLLQSGLYSLKALQVNLGGCLLISGLLL